MHRDIKGANIFLKAVDPKHPEKIVLKLGDFGCSIKFKDTVGTSINTRAKATGFMGTFRKPNIHLCTRKIIIIKLFLKFCNLKLSWLRK